MHLIDHHHRSASELLCAENLVKGSSSRITNDALMKNLFLIKRKFYFGDWHTKVCECSSSFCRRPFSSRDIKGRSRKAAANWGPLPKQRMEIGIRRPTLPEDLSPSGGWKTRVESTFFAVFQVAAAESSHFLWQVILSSPLEMQACTQQWLEVGILELFSNTVSDYIF